MHPRPVGGLSFAFFQELTNTVINTLRVSEMRKACNLKSSCKRRKQPRPVVENIIVGVCNENVVESSFAWNSQRLTMRSVHEL